MLALVDGLKGGLLPLAAVCDELVTTAGATVLIDSDALRGAVDKCGQGSKVRHMNKYPGVPLAWLHEVLCSPSRVANLGRISSTENTSDALTKALDAEVFMKHRDRMGVVSRIHGTARSREGGYV